LWFAHADGTYHVFYLQTPTAIGSTRDWTNRERLAQIGYATSRDLVQWTDRGPVVVPFPGTWRDRIATGSVAPHAGKWWMPFSAAGAAEAVVGLAVSDDLMTWKIVGDGPIVTRRPFAATWQGQPLQWRAVADPYLYPEPVDGWYWMFLNAQVVGAPRNAAGCIGVLRSRDLLAWESAGIVAYPEWLERPETPCVWSHGGRWYLYFGAAHDQPEFPARWTAEVPGELKTKRRVNCIFMADKFEGPYLPKGTWWYDRKGHPAITRVGVR